MADSKQLPVLQGHWRLLEPGECTISGDEMLYRDKWLKLQPEEYNIEVITSIIRRRVPPPPTCGTCEYWEHRDPTYYVKGFCSLLEIDMADCDYCSRHTKAQEVTR